MRRLLIAGVCFAYACLAQPSESGNEAERARQLILAGRLDEGIRIYQKLTRSSPQNTVLMLNLSIAEYTAKRYRDAATHASAALQLEPGLIEARLFLGASELELGDIERAVNSLKQVVAARPGDRNARLMLGEALLSAGQTAAAVEQLRSAAELLPANPRVWYALGRALEASGQKAAADQVWERLTALPPSLEFHLRAAAVAQAAGRWREAALEWQEALRLAPEKSSIRTRLGEALLRSRDYAAAMSAVEPLLPSKDAEVEFLYGASLLNLHQPVEAMPHLQTAVAQKPDLLSARAALGQALLQTGKAAEAIPQLVSGLASDHDGSVHFQLFRAYQMTHADAEARRAIAEYQRFRASLGARP